jgi:alcohol dehydrogenase (NADP+)
MFAKALGAKVVVFSHSPNKKDDCMKLGADDFVTTDKDGFEEKYFDKLDFLLSAADAAKIPLDKLLTTLKVGCHAVSVGLPDDKWELHPMMMAGNGASIGTTHIGSKKEA